MEIKIVAGVKGKKNDPPTGNNTKITIDGKEVFCDFFKFKVKVGEPVKWSVGFNDRSKLTELYVKFKQFLRGK